MQRSKIWIVGEEKLFFGIFILALAGMIALSCGT